MKTIIKEIPDYVVDVYLGAPVRRGLQDRYQFCDAIIFTVVRVIVEVRKFSKNLQLYVEMV